MPSRTKYLRVITDDSFTKRIQVVAKSQGKSVSRFARDVIEQTVSVYEDKTLDMILPPVSSYDVSDEYGMGDCGRLDGDG